MQFEMFHKLKKYIDSVPVDIELCTLEDLYHYEQVTLKKEETHYADNNYHFIRTFNPGSNLT